MPEDPLLPKILILFALILVNAFFAAAEIALISLSETKLKKQLEEGDRKVRKLLKLVQAPDRLLSTIQICITLAGFLSSAYAADAFSDRLVRWLMEDVGFTALPAATLNGIMVVLITIVLSYFSLVLGELVPKRLAMKKSDAVAQLTGNVVYTMSVIFRPVIWFLSKSTNAVLRLMRIDPSAEEEEVSEDEILMMVDLGEEQGAIESAEKELIENIFEFNNTTAEDVMIHRTDMVMLWVDDTPEEIISTIRESGLSRIPIYNEDADDIVGILNVRDYFLNAHLPAPKPFRSLLRQAYFVPESVRTDVLFRDMQNKKIHMAIVVDEYGGTSGLVTMEDIIEELVGEIYDEYDVIANKEIMPLQNGSYRVRCSANLSKVFDYFGIDEDVTEVNTVNGWVSMMLDHLPKKDDKFETEIDRKKLKVRVTKADARKAIEINLICEDVADEEEAERTENQ